MAIVLDGMGSDNYPEPEVQAAVDAAEALEEEIILVGRKELLEPRLKSINTKNAPVRVHHAPDVLEMSDKVVESTQKKPQNSMAVGLELVKNGQARAFVTAGSTGAAMFNAIRILKRIPGVLRPVLISNIPTRGGRCAFLDTGANADCRPEFFPEFAIMGSLYATLVLGINDPRIAILANGEEAGKGNLLVKESYPLLEKNTPHFIGNVEPKEVFAGKTDVVLTDGFTGNIFVKTSESVAKFITEILREEISASFIRKLGYLMIKPAFSSLKKMMDPAEVGAALLVGVNGYVFIGHGRSDARALTSALRLAHHTTQADLLSALRQAVQEQIQQTSLSQTSQ